MIQSIIVSLGVIFFPLLVNYCLLPLSRSHLVRCLPLNLFLSFLFTVVIGAVVRQFVGVGFYPSVLVLLLNIFAFFAYLTRIAPKLSVKRIQIALGSGFAKWILVLSLLSIVDLAFIFSRMDLGAVPVLRQPFNTELQRSVIALSAFLNESTSPFLLRSRLEFSSLWYEFGIVCLSLGAHEGFGLKPLLGLLLTTAWMSFYFLFFIFQLFRPNLGVLGLGISFVLVTFHSELFSTAASFLTTGGLGLEVDGSYLTGYLHFRSFKSLVLGFPEQLISLLCLLAALVLPRYLDNREFKRVCRLFFYVCAICFSPVIGGTVFVVQSISLFVLNYLKEQKLKELSISVLLTCVASGTSYFFLTGETVWACLARAYSRASFTPLDALSPAEWFTLPIFYLGIAGPLGVLATLLICLKISNKRHMNSALVFLLPSLFLGLVFNYLITSPSLRAASSICLLGILPLLGLRLVDFKFYHLPIFRPLLIGLVAMSFLSHSAFVYAYLKKPSQMIAGPWGEYLEFSEQVQEKFPGLSVVAARAPKMGIHYPFIMEKVPSFSSISDVLRMGKINPLQSMVLAKINSQNELFPYVNYLGYQAIAWGPLERLVFGEKVQERFIKKGAKPLLTYKSVALYPIADNLTSELIKKYPARGLQFHTAMAAELSDEGWPLEAIDHLVEAVNKKPEDVSLQLNLAKALNRVGRANEAFSLLNRALKKDSNNTELLSEVGMALMRLSQVSEALKAFKRVVDLEPRNSVAINNIGALLVVTSQYEQAAEFLMKGLKVSPKDPQLHINLGRASLGLFDIESAKTHYRLAKKYAKGKQMQTTRREAVFGLADVAVQGGDFEEAVSLYHEYMSEFEDDYQTQAKLADTYMKMGELKKAEDQYREVLKKRPDFEPAERALEFILKSMKS